MPAGVDQKKTSGSEAASEQARLKIILFIVITSFFLLVSFRVSSRLLKTATLLTTRIRHEQSRQALLMRKLVANYSARLDAERWKGADHGDSAGRIQNLEVQVETLKRELLEKDHKLMELTNIYQNLMQNRKGG